MTKEERNFTEIKLAPGETCSICTCGHSKELPFCDDTHKIINEQEDTEYKSLKINNPTDKEIIIKASSSNWETI